LKPGQAIHLYTIWNPKRCPSTIDEHLRVLRNQGAVKWLVLYDEKTEKDYKDILTNQDITRINDQSKNQETILFIQCLNIFHSKIYAGRVKSIEKVTKNHFEDDLLIPKYYAEEAEKHSLIAHYLIELSDLKSLDLEEILNLIPDPEFKSEKFNYPFP
jgi:hypothetical protein